MKYIVRYLFVALVPCSPEAHGEEVCESRGENVNDPEEGENPGFPDPVIKARDYQPITAVPQYYSIGVRSSVLGWGAEEARG